MSETTYTVMMLANCHTPDLMGMRSAKIVLDDSGNNEQSELTLAAARDLVETLDAELYCTQHGEAGRPEYIIVTDEDAQYVATGRNGDMGNYDWSDCKCTEGLDGECCGECRECIDLMIDQDCEYVRSNAVTE